MGKKPRCSEVGLNKGSWTRLEDKILTDYIKRHGEGNWYKLPKSAGLKRCGKSCRLRWLNYLRPDIKIGNISPEEEDLILRMHKLLGNRWSLIAGRLPGRTDNEIKNYWNTTLRKKLELTHAKAATNSEIFTEKGKSPEQASKPKSIVEHPSVQHAIRTKAFRITSKIQTTMPSKFENYDSPMNDTSPNPNDESMVNNRSTAVEDSTQEKAHLNMIYSCYSSDVPQTVTNDNALGTSSDKADYDSRQTLDADELEEWINSSSYLTATACEDDLGLLDFKSLVTFLDLD